MTEEYDAAKYHRLSWMSDAQWECAQMVATLMRGFHHVTGEFKEYGRGIKVCVYGGSLSTFDFDDLTRLVLLAHDRAIRVEIVQGGPSRVGLALWKRKRDGDIYSRHPSMEQALAAWRERYPLSECAP